MLWPHKCNFVPWTYSSPSTKDTSVDSAIFPVRLQFLYADDFFRKTLAVSYPFHHVLRRATQTATPSPRLSPRVTWRLSQVAFRPFRWTRQVSLPRHPTSTA